MTKIGIIGLGNIAKKHIQALKELNVKKIFGYDIDSKKVDKYKSDYGITGYYNKEDLFNNSDIISICTPHNTHFDLFVNGLENGKIVVVEKPFNLDANEINKLDKYDLNKSFIMFQNRFNNAVVKAKEIIDSGNLGNIYYIKGFTKWHRDDFYYSSSDWKGKKLREGGIIYNQGIHNIETALWLVGKNNQIEDINLLYKNTDKFRKFDIETEDYILLLFGIGNIKYEYSLITYGDKGNSENSILIIGDKGSLKIGGEALNILEYVNFNGDINNLNIKEEFSNVYGSGHYKFYKNLLAQNYDVLPSIYDGINITVLFDKI